jgi:4-aminobutyrate aminotransferase-like enzyme
MRKEFHPIRNRSRSEPKKAKRRSVGQKAKTQGTLDLLERFESQNVTFIERDRSWPIVWERARGVHVWDADGERYLDLTAAFGVAAAGHSNSQVVRAGQRQMTHLLHAMGDVHPHRLKAQLARELSRITFERWPQSRETGKTIFCNSGFEAVEAALKTAALVTGKPGVIAFSGGYHGLGYGALNVTHREQFRLPFRRQLAEFGHFVPFPLGPASARPRDARSELSQLEQSIRNLCRKRAIGAILVEPVQARGGIRIPPPSFLRLLRRICDELDLVLICDEVFTGFGRTGRWFACEHSGVIPDLICLGKALTGGFPLSVCVGKAALMDSAWPPSTGEAIHTSTFLGHPVGCAMALAQIAEISGRKLVARSANLGERLLSRLHKVTFPGNLTGQIRGIGLMAGVELTSPDGSPATAAALRAIKLMLHEGFILLPEGEFSNVISFTPPLTISERDLARCVNTLSRILHKVAAGE